MESGRLTFDRPPVVEVVCGARFKPLSSELAYPRIWRYWQQFMDQFPRCQEVPPVPLVIESYEDREPTAEIEFGQMPPWPRLWFMEKDENGVLQLQRDGLLYNWRKVRKDDGYPRFDFVRDEFFKRLGQFESFLGDEGHAPLEMQQFELTYINQLPIGHGWRELEDIGELFPDFAWRKSPERRPLTNINVTTAMDLGEKTGRVHVTLRHGKLRTTKERVLNLEITVRGYPGVGSQEEMRAWFGVAHAAVNETFVGLTNKKAQIELWGRVS